MVILQIYGQEFQMLGTLKLALFVLPDFVLTFLKKRKDEVFYRSVIFIRKNRQFLMLKISKESKEKIQKKYL